MTKWLKWLNRNSNRYIANVLVHNILHTTASIRPQASSSSSSCSFLLFFNINRASTANFWRIFRAKYRLFAFDFRLFLHQNLSKTSIFSIEIKSKASNQSQQSISSNNVAASSTNPLTYWIQDGLPYYRNPVFVTESH